MRGERERRERRKRRRERLKRHSLAVSTHRPIQQTEPPLPPRMDGQLLVTHREEEGKERGRGRRKRGMEKEGNDQASNEGEANIC